MQLTGETVGEIRAVSDMHQRKAEMARQADAFIALPGATLDHSDQHQISQMKRDFNYLPDHAIVSLLITYDCISSGGYGTLEELLEVITWAQLGIHRKPVSHFPFIFLPPPTLSFITENGYRFHFWCALFPRCWTESYRQKCCSISKSNTSLILWSRTRSHYPQGTAVSYL